MLSRGVVYMLISTLAFSIMQLCVKFLKHIPAHELVLFRSLISLILSFSYLKFYGIPVWGNNKKFLILRGVFGAVALTTFFITLQQIPLAGAVTLQYLSPIFTAIIATFVLNEKTKKFQWLFFLISFIGVTILKGFDERIALFHLGLAITSSFFSSMAYTCIRILKDSDHPLVVVFYFPLVAIPFVGVACLFDWVTPLGIDWLFILGAGFFTQIGQVYMTRAIQKEEINRVSVLKYIGTVYALIFGYFFFGETYSLITLGGILLVLTGVLLNIYFTSIKTKS